MMSKGLWTEDETARLMDLFKAGHSFTQIGRILDRWRARYRAEVA